MFTITEWFVLETVLDIVKVELMEECPDWKPLGHLVENQLSTCMPDFEAEDEPELSESEEEVCIRKRFAVVRTERSRDRRVLVLVL